ncbi:unnamed protein product [Rotaria sordida]|uniref:Uncharacterized protein n=1 Tax=Rotaria sordida TaxID=392033 RepID=A0A815E829_9BILA|nr:unnamed protein product [Rotaria sordida]CAF3738129.1 unnamed protein product [Rotaria sordida]
MKKSKHIRRVVSVGPLDRKIVKSSNESKLSHINFKNSEARNTHVASKSHQDQTKRPRTTTAVVRVSRSQLSSFTICKFPDQQQSPNNVEQPFNDQLIHDDIYATISSDVQIDLDHNIQTPLSTKTLADQVSKHSARSSSRIHPEKINVSQIDCNSINDRIRSNNSFKGSINSHSIIKNKQIIDNQFVSNTNKKNNQQSFLTNTTKEKHRHRHRRCCGIFWPCCTPCCCLLTGLLLSLILVALALLIFFLISSKTTTTIAQQLHLRAAQQLRLQPAQQLHLQPAQQLRLQPAQQLRLQLVQQLRLQPAQQLRLLAAQQQQRQQQQQHRQQQVNLNS